MYRRLSSILFMLFVAGFVAACGGGESTTSTTTPSISTQPSNQSAQQGGTATFSVTATGAATLTYQWRKDGTAIAGATSDAYAIASVGPADAGSYDVVVSNSAGSVTSSAATLTVGPAITTQPVSQNVAVGSSFTLSVAASGSSPLSYQWRKGGTAITGATAASYTVNSAASADAGSYDVVVTNAAGSATSNAAALTVGGTMGSTVPSITTQPASQSVAVGASATFTVAATGASPLTYQWYKDAAAIAGATSNSYVIASVTSASAGSYTVIVANSAGTATSTAAVLTVGTTTTGTTSAATVAAAQNFLATLTASQQSTVQLSWSLDTARRWSNLPASLVSRNGVSWGSLSSSQQAAARTMISAALSSTGNTLHAGMQAADDVLVSQHGASSSQYGNGYYYIAFVGTPSTSDFWLLQLTGHHLTYNVAFNGSYLSPTPMFLGVEPKDGFTLNGTTYDPMGAQRDAFGALGGALASYSGALLSGTYSDLLFGANGSGGIDGTYPKSYPTGTTGRGVLYSSLSSSDQSKVKAVIQAYVNTQTTEYANALLAAYLSDAALAETYVAYAGSSSVGTNGAYFRVDGPRVWIELSVQRGVVISSDIHYHSIWRDKVGDYGGRCCS